MSYAHDLARAYNERLWTGNPRLAAEIEWVADGSGNVRLRDIPERAAARTKAIDARREAERDRWVREHGAEHRPFAPIEEAACG